MTAVTITALDKMTAEHVANVNIRGSVFNSTAALQALLDHQIMGVMGSKELSIPDGKYVIGKTGLRILEIQGGTKLVGSALEGTTLFVSATSTASCALEDKGSAAKIEISNLTIMGNGNTSLTSGLRLGPRDIQFGTYGTLDNLMVRNMPNATAYDIDCNIASVGKLYSVNTKDGLIAHPNGSGLHILAFTPLGFTGIGLQQASADSCEFLECEAPAADTAIPLLGERALNVGTFILSIGPARTVKTPVQLNPTYVDDYFLGPTTVFYSGPTARFGDVDASTADDSGTVTVWSYNTLSDSSKQWRIDQWVGAAVHIIGGTGVGQWRRVATNTKSALIIEGTWTIDATSMYTLTNFIRKTGGGGYPHSNSLSAYWPAFYNMSVSNEMRANSATIGTIRIEAGSSTNPPLKLMSGPTMATPQLGGIEYNGTNLFFTRSGSVRENVLTQSAVTVETAVPDVTVTVNIDGTDYKLLAKK